ncbi:unnamed protein product [Lactuca virosa]|uniref:Uncharacterized protein n=1 Tax=Lactuca virosa TaxID=75947 RepID=A0AAU9NS12_9ASTR|nr:unnamed protein product [Lactuca virosa]
MLDSHVVSWDRTEFNVDFLFQPHRHNEEARSEIIKDILHGILRLSQKEVADLKGKHINGRFFLHCDQGYYRVLLSPATLHHHHHCCTEDYHHLLKDGKILGTTVGESSINV